MQTFLYSRRELMSKDSFKRVYGPAYEGLSDKEGKFIAYPLFFFYRRLLLPLAIIMLPTTLTVHYATLTVSGLATIILIGLTRPFVENNDNKAEILHELVIIVIMYHIFCFTDFVPNMQARHMLGYSVMVCILTHLLVFYVLKLIGLVKYIRKWYRRRVALSMARK